MEMVIWNPQKGRLETIKVTINDTNTTWFDDCLKPDDVYMITDTDNGLLIRENNYNYPVLVYDVSRSDIDNNPQEAKVLREDAMPE
ncbi:MAG: hypothetical protein LWX55_15060 [Deltaproteobacteria bacterium]|jgi:hypothetical protein|nr:hypothetical protein [Deltaproteobacteria bacterium]